MKEREYLKLVDITGRIARTGKRGHIDLSREPILERLGLTTEQWTEASTNFKQCYWNGDIRLKQSA